MRLVSFFGFLIFPTVLFSQQIPVSFPILNDFLRREQILGNIDEDFSFNYRPLQLKKAFPDFRNAFLLDSTDGYQPIELEISLPISKLEISPLPLQLTTVLNSNYPYGWGNGAIIPARGIQTLLSAGIHLQYGKLNVQLYPQFHFVQNLPFEEYPKNAPRVYFTNMSRDLGGIEIPVRFGNHSIYKLLPGNSHIMMEFGSFAAGISTENIWWGPGQFNALLLSDNAQGFLHATLKTIRPAKTFLGKFEGQFFMGKLNGYGGNHFSDGAYKDIFPAKSEDNWRYFTGISVAYSPKWVKGFSIGMNRTFQVYREDMRNNLRAWFPIFDPFPKKSLGLLENIFLREDQHVSAFARWVLPKVKAEFYFEYLRNDHPYNYRDLIMNIEQSRAYLMGFTKIFQSPEFGNFMLRAEMNHTQIPLNNIIRVGGIGIGVYYNGDVRHGLTNQGQVLGSGAGASGNLYTLEFSKINKYNRAGFLLERLARNQNFYHYANDNWVNVLPWVDLTGGIFIDHHIKNLLVKGVVKGVRSHNFHWYVDQSQGKNDFAEGRKSFNLYSECSVAYIF